eukprot:217-Amorphochlora_amoeboformis.AAC.1
MFSDRNYRMVDYSRFDVVAKDFDDEEKKEKEAQRMENMMRYYKDQEERKKLWNEKHVAIYCFKSLITQHSFRDKNRAQTVTGIVRTTRTNKGMVIVTLTGTATKTARATTGIHIVMVMVIVMDVENMGTTTGNMGVAFVRVQASERQRAWDAWDVGLQTLPGCSR